MTEPDELYTLRAQFWLGHYGMAMDEAKSVARRPMSPALKAEREDFLARAYIALGQYDKVVPDETPALQALALRAQLEAVGAGNEAVRESLIQQLKALNGAHPVPSVQLTTAHVLLAAGQTKEALQAVHLGATMEHLATALLIYLKMDRLDLAKQQLSLLKQADEDAILTQLGSVYVHLATGSTGAADALHTLTALSEQYGPSPYLLNLQAAAWMQQGDYTRATTLLQECVRDHAEAPLPDTTLNLLAASAHQEAPASTNTATLVGHMKQHYPQHAFCAGYDRVVAAFDREAMKYKL